MGKKRSSRSLTITHKTISELANLAAWRSALPPKPTTKAVTHDSGTVAVSREQAELDRLRARPKKKKNKKHAISVEPLINATESIGGDASPNPVAQKKNAVKQPRILKEPSETIAIQSDHRLCELCGRYFHKTRIDAHKLRVHRVRPQSPPPRGSADIALTVSGIANVPDRRSRVKSRLNAAKAMLLKRKQTRQTEFQSEGDQPSFEGGIHWVQGGSPGLGKRR